MSSPQVMRPVVARCKGYDGSQRCNQKLTGELVVGYCEEMLATMVQRFGWRALFGDHYCPIHAPLPDKKGPCWEYKKHDPHTVYQVTGGGGRGRHSFGLRRCLGRLEDFVFDD